MPAYVGSQFGFNNPGKEYLSKILYPDLKMKAGVLALCPFTACGEYLDLSKLSSEMKVGEEIEIWNRFNKIIGEVNYETLMPHSNS